MRYSTTTRRLVQLIGISIGTIAAGSPSSAATIVVPPVAITALYDSSNYGGMPGRVCDSITIPARGSTHSGFSATITTGDVVVVRIQAPAGKKFVVHAPFGATPGVFSFSLYWQTGTVDGISHLDTHAMTFENFHGSPPAETYSLVALGDQLNIVEVWKMFSFSEGFEFTAIEFRVTASSPLPPVALTFFDVASYTMPAFLAVGITPTPTAPIMELVDAPVAARRSSWGTIKALYR